VVRQLSVTWFDVNLCAVYMESVALAHMSEFWAILWLSVWLPYTHAMKTKKCTANSLFYLVSK